MIKILITSETESEINAIQNILVELNNEAELLFHSREDEVTRCLLEDNVDICVMDYEMPNHRYRYIQDFINDHDIPVVVVITAEPQHYQHLRFDNNLTRNIVLLKPLNRDTVLFFFQRIIDQDSIAKTGEYRPELQALWRRTKPQLMETFWNELLCDRISRRTFRVGQKENLALYQSAISAGIKGTDVNYILPIIFFSRNEDTGNDMDYLNRKNIFETLSRSVVIREDEGYTYFFSEKERVVLFYPYDLRLTVNRAAHRCFQFCKEMERQFQEDLACVVGEPCHAGELSQQRTALQHMAEQNRFRGERIFFLGSEEKNASPMEYAPVAKWAKLVLDGQTEQIRKEVTSFFEINRNHPLLTTDYVTNIVYDIDRYITITASRMEFDFSDLAANLDLRKRFVSAFRSPESFLSWITALSELCIQCKTKNRNSSSVLDIAMEYIQRNLSGDLNRQKIAEYVHVSQNYLARLFREKMQTTISEYITKERMERAKDYLSKSSLSITEISQRVGYGSSTYFSSSFKQYTGLSPQAFRKET